MTVHRLLLRFSWVKSKQKLCSDVGDDLTWKASLPCVICNIKTHSQDHVLRLLEAFSGVLSAWCHVQYPVSVVNSSLLTMHHIVYTGSNLITNTLVRKETVHKDILQRHEVKSYDSKWKSDIGRNTLREKWSVSATVWSLDKERNNKLEHITVK